MQISEKWEATLSSLRGEVLAALAKVDKEKVEVTVGRTAITRDRAAVVLSWNRDAETISVQISEMLLHISQLVQGDHSGCVKPPVDTKTKVAFKYMGLIPKRNFCFDVNRRFGTTFLVTLYNT